MYKKDKIIKVLLILYVLVNAFLICGCEQKKQDTEVDWKEPAIIVKKEETRELVTTQGRTIILTNNDIGIADTKIIIPDGLVEKNETFIIKRLNSEDLEKTNYNSLFTMVHMSPVFELGSDTNKFSTPVTIEIPFFPKRDVSTDEVKLVYYSNDVWNEVNDYIIDNKKNVAIAKVTHFTPFLIKYSSWPNYQKTDLNLDKIKITKVDGYIRLECFPADIGKYGFEALEKYLDLPYSNFELMYLIRLKRKTGSGNDEIIKEKQYHNVILVNKNKRKMYEFDKTAKFSSWTFTNTAFNAWGAFNGFKGPYDNYDGYKGVHKFLTTVEFDGNGVQINSPNSKYIELSDSVYYQNDSIIGDYNNKMFKILDDFISISDLPDSSSEYYFEIKMQWAEAGFDKFAFISTDLSDDPNFKPLVLDNMEETESIIIENPYNQLADPEAPKNLKAYDITSNSFNLSWDTIGNVKYHIYINGNEYGTSNYSNLDILNLSPNTEYLMQVAAENNYGTGERSETFKVFTEPAPPTNISSTDATSTSFKLYWDNMDNIIKYHIYIDNVLYNSTSSNSITITGLNIETSYSIQISSENFSTEGKRSDEVIVRTLPDNIKNIWSENNSKNSIDIKWTERNDIVKYHIYKDNIWFDETTSNSINISSLFENTVYTFDIVAENSSGKGEHSESIDIRTFKDSDFSTWRNITTNTYLKRKGHTCLEYNNKIWIIAGNNANLLNSIMSSSNGNSWDIVTDNATFSSREDHCSLVFDNKMWVIGGNDENLKNDVWYSTNGINWTNAINNAAFSARKNSACAVFNNKMWLIGGDDGNLKNDIYSSSDGISWNLENASANFSKRKGHKCIVFNNKLWLIGGNDGNLKNDIYSSSDGINWNLENASANFSPRNNFSLVKYNSKLWIIGGYDGNYKNDLWYSKNGTDWTEISTSENFSEREKHCCITFDNKIFIIGGNNSSEIKKDSWTYKVEAPTNLAYSSITDSSFTLSWDAISEPVTYHVYKNNVEYSSTTSTSLSINGLAANTEYSMQVAGEINSNIATRSDELKVLTLHAKPVNLAESNKTKKSFTLSWDSLPSPVTYHVYKDNIEYGSSTTNSMNITGLSSSTAYSMEVSGENASGNGDRSNVLNVTTSPNILPVISNVIAIDGAGNIPVTFNITDGNNDLCSIDVFYSIDGGSNWTNTTNIIGTTSNITPGNNKNIIWSSANDFTLTENNVKIKIQPTDDEQVGISDISNTFAVSNNNVPIINNVVVSGNSGDISVTYDLSDGNNDLCSIKIYYSKDNGSTWAESTSLTGTTKDLVPSNNKTITWNSLNDITTNEQIKLKVTPNDGQFTGSDGISSTFYIHNNTPPIISNVSAPSGDHDIIITYDLSDANSDNCSITVDYSIDNGSTWINTTNLTGSASGISPGNNKTITWNSYSDITTNKTVKIKITPSDSQDEGTNDISNSFNVNNNSKPIISNVSAPNGSGNIIITYTLVDADNDNCSITINYSIDNGVTWTSTTNLTGSTSGIAPGIGKTITWNSSSDITTNETVKIKITPNDGQDSGTVGTSNSFTVNNNSVPSVSNVSAPNGDHDIIITYDLSDTDNDNCSITVDYSTDNGTTWTSTTHLTGSTSNIPVGNNKTITWNSLSDITTNETVKIRITPNDGQDSGNSDISNSFTVNNNSIPVISNVSALNGDHDIIITYNLSDANNDNCSITIDYSIDNGSTWSNTANLTGFTLGITPGNNKTITWNSYSDITTNETVKIRIKPNDGQNGGETVNSNSFTVNNNSKPVISNVSSPNGDHDIIITYDLSDTDNDNCSINVNYSIDNGVTWTSTTHLTGSVSGITPGNNKTITWNSYSDITTNETVKIKITPNDGQDSGTAGISNSFSVKNNSIPVISNVSAPNGDHDIIITYDLSDADTDLCSITVDYSIDNGVTWTPTNHLTGSTSNIPVGNNKTITWNSFSDITINESTVKVRIKPNDSQDKGETVVSNTFTVSNNTPPTISNVNVNDGRNEMKIVYDLVDPNNDNCSISLEYSLDNGGSWSSTTHLIGTTSGIAPGTGKIITWDSTADTLLTVPNAKVRITPNDSFNNGTVGTSNSFVLGNNDFPTISNVLIADGSNNITVTYDLTDINNDNCSIKFYYSLDNETSWNETTNLTGSVSGISPGIKRTIVWNSGNDFSTDESTVEVKIVPYDPDGIGIKGISNNAHIDNVLATFEDENLEAAIKLRMGNPLKILKPNMDFVDLDASGRNITDLSGLEWCSALKDLNLSNNNITDLSSLKDITTLDTLDLSNNNIGDISDLVSNTGLTGASDTINLTNNPPLDTTTPDPDIITLQGRGITVTY